ncbi:MAG: hypothetical protein WD960_05315 [Gemmatimonadota bacterium]
MNVYFLPRPERAELATRPLQSIVRDYPETLAYLRKQGVAPEDFAELEVGDLYDPELLLDELESVTRWRPERATA